MMVTSGQSPTTDDIRPGVDPASVTPRSAAPEAELPTPPEREARRGDAPYLAILRLAHEILRPSLYLEIGVRAGASLRLASGNAVGVDPMPAENLALRDNATLVKARSDEFFTADAARLLQPPPELIFIDGMHLFEYALRDFINVERHAAPGALAVIDDIFPNHPVQGRRRRQSSNWMGDVWRLFACLREERPDLFLLPLDTFPGGLLLVAGLDPNNDTLRQRYDDIVGQLQTAGDDVPPAILAREGVMSARAPFVTEMFTMLRTFREQKAAPATIVARLRAARAATGSEPRSLKLSVVVVCFNMRRELPRTVWSLSPALQRGIAAEDYEIIVVDNGSTKPFDREECRRYGGNIAFHDVPNATPSPAAAINLGLAQAKGELIGVMIDGARLASPGLLAGAMNAAKLHHRPVVATLAFHLGPDMQTASARWLGYDQKREDELLASVKWEANPYRLFEIACFAGSSRGGWFAALRECNALFLKAAHWRELGGCDEAFQSPAGGLANHDMWIRAVSSPDNQVIVLLGEGTFHQIHNDFSTWKPDRLNVFRAEYQRIRGRPYQALRYSPIFVGSVPPAALTPLEYSAGMPRHRQGPWRGERASAVILALGERPFRAGIGAAAVNMVNQGAMRMHYRGAPLQKSPFDMALYTQLIGRLLPRTIIEIGTKNAGSACWFADLQRAHNIGGRVIAIDEQPPPAIEEPGIEFRQGSAAALLGTLSREFLASVEHPLLIVGNGGHRYEAVLSILQFFHPIMSRGDYFVVEGGVVSQLFGAQCAAYHDGPNRALAEFLKKHGKYYEIDIELCDFYGHNVTWNPNGWLRRR
jgi:cephalosporin hydroxylase/glycosyltransferase involved in cell wall biosynthesis